MQKNNSKAIRYLTFSWWVLLSHLWVSFSDICQHIQKQKDILHFLTQVGLVEPARRAIHWMPSMIVERQVIPNFLPIPGWIALIFCAKLLTVFCQVYLGRADQASDSEVISSPLIFIRTSMWHQPNCHRHCEKVIHGLGITHVLSTSRIRASKFRGLVYILVNKVSKTQNEQNQVSKDYKKISKCIS